MAGVWGPVVTGLLLLLVPVKVEALPAAEEPLGHAWGPFCHPRFALEPL